MKKIISIFLCSFFSLNLVSCDFDISNKMFDDFSELNKKVNEEYEKQEKYLKNNNEKFDEFYCDSIDFNKYKKKNLNNLKLYNTFNLPFNIEDMRKCTISVDGINEGNTDESITSVFDYYFLDRNGKEIDNRTLSKDDAIPISIQVNKFNSSTFDIKFIVKNSKNTNKTISKLIKEEKYYIMLNSYEIDEAFKINKYEKLKDKDFFNVDKLMLPEVMKKLGKPDKLEVKKREPKKGEPNMFIITNKNGTAYGKALTKTACLIYKTNGSIIEIILEEKQTIARKIDFIDYKYNLSANIYSEKAYNLKSQTEKQ